jgi:putative transposase
LKPTQQNRELLQQFGGSVRFIWNKMLELNQNTYKQTQKFVFSNDMITSLPQLKQQYPWLANTPSPALQQKCMDLDKALKSKFKSKFGFPKFKNKHQLSDSFRIPQINGHIQITNKQIKIPKIGWVKWKKHRPLQGKLKNITVKQEGKDWYCICLCEVPDTKPITNVHIDDIIGVDLGIKTFAVTSDGEMIEKKPLYKQAENKLKKKQRQLSKSKLRGKNRNRKIIELRKIHKKVANQRKDFCHKKSTLITNDYLIIGLEDLNIKGMIKNHKLAKSIQDQGWGMFGQLVQYKSLRNGGNTIFIDRWSPSTKTCNCCGNKKNITLNTRTYICAVCGMEMDRDLNAGINIKNMTVDLIKNRYGAYRIYEQGDTAGGDENLVMCRRDAKSSSQNIERGSLVL